MRWFRALPTLLWAFCRLSYPWKDSSLTGILPFAESNSYLRSLTNLFIPWPLRKTTYGGLQSMVTITRCNTGWVRGLWASLSSWGCWWITRMCLLKTCHHINMMWYGIACLVAASVILQLGEIFWVRLPAGTNTHHSIEVIAAVMLQMGWDLFLVFRQTRIKQWLKWFRGIQHTFGIKKERVSMVDFQAGMHFSFVFYLVLVAMQTLWPDAGMK